MARPGALAAASAWPQALGSQPRRRMARGRPQARAAAFIITAAEGGACTCRPAHAAADFEPLSRDRLMAGALLPAAWYAGAARAPLVRDARSTLSRRDVLLAPATPCTWRHRHRHRVARHQRPASACAPSMGLLTQPISCIGLPVVTVPLWPCRRRAAPADRRAAHRRALARRPVPARGAGAESAGVGSAKVPRSDDPPMDINLPEVLAEVSAVFARYEDALVNNRRRGARRAVLDSPHTVRYGVGENLYGIEAIRAFRAARPRGAGSARWATP
jgi:hypothetical protein